MRSFLQGGTLRAGVRSDGGLRMGTRVEDEVGELLSRAERVPQSDGKLALQVVPVRMRHWVADGDKACRPWYVIVLELYPRGKVVAQKANIIVSQKPSPQFLVQVLATHIVDPESGVPTRPTHVSFVEEHVTEICKPLLKKLRVQCETLTLADGVDNYVKMFSEKLVDMDKASRGDSAERPGLLKIEGVSLKLASGVNAAAVAMYGAAAWNKIKETVALQVLLPRTPKSTYRERFYASVLGSDGKVFGFALMPTLESLRTKYRRALASRDPNYVEFANGDQADASAPADIQNSPQQYRDSLLCASCGKRVGQDPSMDGGHYVYRCAGCKRLLYCGEACQRSDWRTRHREECSKAAADPEFVFTRPQWAWLKRELALLFVDPTAMPFDDLDDAEKHNWPYIDDASPPLHPFPFVTTMSPDGVTKRVERPTASELVILTHVATALTECVAPLPQDCTLHLANGVSISVADDLAQSQCKSQTA